MVAVSCWNRSRDTTTTTSSSCAPLTSSSLHHDVQPTPTSMKTAVLPLTPQPPAETSSTGSPVASTTGPGTQNTATETAGLGPVVYGALTGVAVVLTLSTAVLAVCMMWRLARSRRRHIPSAGQWNEVHDTIIGGGLTTDPFPCVCRCGGEGAGDQPSLPDHCQPHPLLPQ